METKPTRTSEEVIELAEHAKLIPGDLLPLTQSIYFADNFGDEGASIKLLEIDPELLVSLEKEHRFTIRGEENDSSILCSKSKTFEMRIAETSNSLLLVPNLKLPEEIPNNMPHSVNSNYVTGLHHQYLELKMCKPKLHRLKILLEENVYCGNLLDDSEEKVYSFNDILSKVQASEEEIKSELGNLKAYKINGYWRILEFDYHYKILWNILTLIDSNSWSLDKVPKKETLETLAETEIIEVIAQCFHYYFEKVDPLDADDDLYRICDNKVSCFCAEMFLRASRQFNLEEFLSIWQQGVPEGIITNINQIEGVALIDESAPASIKYFPSSSLPENPVERFTALFRERTKWTMNEIRPYLSELTSDQCSVSSLLAKYARGSTVDGIKYYCSKYLVR